MGGGLVFAGEVQVDIRHLVALEAKEGFKRNVEAVLDQRIAADRAFFVRQIHADGVLGRNVKIGLAAGFAAVMGRQGIDFRDAGEEGHEGGTHRPTAAHHVPVRQGFFHQLLGDGIKRAVAVAHDGVQFLVDALLYDVRQIVPVQAVGGAVGEIFDIVLRFGPEGGEGGFALRVLGEQAHFADAGGDELGVFDDHLVGLFLAQIGEFLQHFVGGLEVQGRLIVGVGKALARLDDGAENRVLRVEKMHVPGSAHGQAQLFA